MLLLTACPVPVQSTLSGTVMDHIPKPHVTSEYLHYISHRCAAGSSADTLVCLLPNARCCGSQPACMSCRQSGRKAERSPGAVWAARYFALPKTLVFAEVPADLSGLPTALEDAFTGAGVGCARLAAVPPGWHRRSGEGRPDKLPTVPAPAGLWMYKPFEHRREPLELRLCAKQAASCNATQFQQELVSLYSRWGFRMGAPLS